MTLNDIQKRFREEIGLPIDEEETIVCHNCHREYFMSKIYCEYCGEDNPKNLLNVWERKSKIYLAVISLALFLTLIVQRILAL